MVSRRRVGLVGGGVVALAVLVLIGGLVAFPRFQRWRNGSIVDNALRREVTAPFMVPAAGIRGPITVIGETPSTTGIVTVAVNPPVDAQAIRLDSSPNFTNKRWQPIEPEVDVPVTDIGDQTIYAQFFLADGTISDIAVAGVTIDPTYAAATSSRNGPHQPSWVRPFSPTELVVRIEAGRLSRGAMEPYDLTTPVDGDKVSKKRGRLVVERSGEIYGLQVSKRDDAVRRPDQLIGRPLDISAVTGEDWTIRSDTDSAYDGGLVATSVRYIARPGASGVDSSLDRIHEVTYDLVILVPSPLVAGATYTIEPPEEVAPAAIDYDPATNLSPAIRVNQVGFAPEDGLKLGYLSGWFDGMGTSATDLNPQPDFQVIDVVTGDVAKRGRGELRGTLDEMGKGDLTGAPVITLDFSSLNRPGRYRLCVDQVGCSYHFDIDNRVWHDLTTTVARAMYHQRSGIELGPPYTSTIRPRPYHPEDGATVTASRYSLLQAQTDTANTDFEALTEQATTELVPEAWGGHFDAGDWDRRINHLWYARNAAQLVIRFPTLAAELEMNIPESGDAVPDILDEALWTVELFKRMQLPSGAIRGGIEASEHPPADTASWADDLAVFAYEPDPYSSYIYAGVVAEVAVALRPYDRERSDELLRSALAAMNWAQQAATADGGASGGVAASAQQQAIGDQRSVAAAALLMATGDPDWHELFVRSAEFLDDSDPYMSCHAHIGCDAAWLYLQTDESLTDPEIRADLRGRFIFSADAIVAAADSTAYGWTTENPFVPLVWGLGSGGAPHTSGLLKAYLLTGDDRYRSAATRSAGVALGANPLNRALLTGVGTEPVRNPQINDVRFGGLELWPGTPVYGSHQLNALNDDSWVVRDMLGPAGASPSPESLPYLWQWYDVDTVAMFNEFTVHQSHSEALLTFATLAATTATTG